MFQNIPAELRAYPQWVLWRLEWRETKPTKVPYSPTHFGKASVTNPADWGTFTQACNCGPFLEQGVAVDPTLPVSVTGFSGIGFVLTDADPFTFIDLDDTHGDTEAYERQVKVFREFNSYSEFSPSGSGLHIIAKGSIPIGRRRASIEMYSRERYMTMTGNVYHGGPIENRQELINILWEQMGGAAQTYTYGDDKAEKEPDDAIISQAANAANGDKFSKLFEGDWQSLYSSQSEADFALVDIVAFYTQNRAQIARIFRRSALGQRDKAKRDKYIWYMVEKSFDRQLPPVDIEGLKAQVAAMMAARVPLPVYQAGSAAGEPSGSPAAPVAAVACLGAESNALASHGSEATSTAFPPGLVGEVADFIYRASPRPVYEMALAAAYGLLAGIAGRAYNVSGTGLNQYVLVLAMTGAGKEAPASGIAKLMHALQTSVPVSSEFIGPGEIVSSPGLIKWLGKCPSIVSLVGEFGYKLREMSNPQANIHIAGLKRTLLDLYNKSGQGNVFNPMAYSDRERNTEVLHSPAFTILGESTPESFYNNLDESMIADGLLPRFMVIEYKGKRVRFNEGHNLVPVPFELSERLASLAAHCLTLAHNRQVHNVTMTSDAKAIFDRFNDFCDHEINNAHSEVARQLWNRGHIKALKLAALYAVGTDYINPLIVEGMAQRACDEIAEQTHALRARFDSGEYGSSLNEADEAKQMDEICRTVGIWSGLAFEQVSKYRMSFEMHRDGVFPYSSIVQKLACVACFRKDRRGSSWAIERCFKQLLDNDDLREISKDQMLLKYGRRQRAFCISNPKRFVAV